MRALLPLLLASALAGAEPALVPQALVVHRDGARLHCTVAVPAGTTTVAIPWRRAGAISARGAAWSLADEPVPAAAAERPGDDLRRLVLERNLLAVEEQTLTGRRAAHARSGERIRTGLTAAAAQTGLDPAPWQRSLDAWLAERDALDAATAKLDAQRASLRERAVALAPDAGDWLRVDRREALGYDEAERAVAGVPRPASTRRVLRLATSAPATVAVEIEMPVLWSPSAVLTMAGPEARLVRVATLTKPDDLDLGTLPVTVTTTPLAPVLQGGDAPRIRVAGQPIPTPDRRRVVTGATASQWSEAPVSAGVTIPVPDSVAALAPAAARAPAAAPPAAPTGPEPLLPDPDAPALAWDLGPLALAAGETAVAAQRPPAPVTVVADEWALVPEIAPVAIRRLQIRLDDQPLLGGVLALLVDGAPAGSGEVDSQPAGALLALRAGEDAAVFAAPAVAWSVAPSEQTARRQRQGSTIAVHNLGEAPRTVALYRTMPVSRSAELKITPAAGTSEGSTAVEPGVLRWTLTLAPGTRQEIGLGWVLEASGNVTLQ